MTLTLTLTYPNPNPNPNPTPTPNPTPNLTPNPKPNQVDHLNAVIKVGDDSEAEGKLLPGDLVTAVNGQALGSGASLQSALAEQFVQEGDDVVLECRRSLEVDHAHEQQRRFGRTKPRRTGAGEDVSRLLPGRAFHTPPLTLTLTLTLTLGEDVSKLLPSRAFHERKSPLEKAMLAAKARVRRGPSPSPNSNPNPNPNPNCNPNPNPNPKVECSWDTDMGSMNSGCGKP